MNNFKFRFNPKAFAIFVLIFIVEVLIAIFIHDVFIRPYGGDILVVMLMYYFVKAFIQTKPINIILPILLFSYLVEFAQYLDLPHKLGITNKILLIITGSSFSWVDMLCYTVGAAICWLIDRRSI